MGTEKRERQKANKARREQEVAREAAKARTTRLALIIGGAIVAVFALVFIAGQFVGDDEPDDVIIPVDSAPGDGDALDDVDVSVADPDEVEAPPVAEPDTGTDTPSDSAADADS